jgi:hypothetical protein
MPRKNILIIIFKPEWKYSLRNRIFVLILKKEENFQDQTDQTQNLVTK